MFSNAVHMCTLMYLLTYFKPFFFKPTIRLLDCRNYLKVNYFFSEDGALVTIDVGLAYRDDTVSEWTEMAHSYEQRKLSCNFTTTKVRTRHAEHQLLCIDKH